MSPASDRLRVREIHRAFQLGVLRLGSDDHKHPSLGAIRNSYFAPVVIKVGIPAIELCL